MPPEGLEEHDGFEEIVRQVPEPTQLLARSARDLIYRVYPAAVEVPWPRQRVIGYGVGPKKMSEHFGYLSVASRHVNIGFSYGAELPDPAGLLAGEGAVLRHVRISRPEDLERPELADLLQAAVRHLPRLPADDPRIPRP